MPATQYLRVVSEPMDAGHSRYHLLSAVRKVIMSKKVNSHNLSGIVSALIGPSQERAPHELRSCSGYSQIEITAIYTHQMKG